MYTNKKLYTYLEILSSISAKVTGKIAYVVTKNARKIQEELVEYIKIRDELINKYGEIQGNQKVIINNTEGYTKFIAEMSEYDDIEQNISFLTITPKDLYSSELNAIEINQLMFMINEEDE